ncbi:hypothetical protein SO802_005599 [Lithocarpus litseifolius]|uniref:Uncharacterized protein n=1 Tax=Lithocarpus litseifolius TaxID=425828 RepID=A0AAW2DP62_9ROSI
MFSCTQLQVLNECVEAEAWLREKRLQQDSPPKYVNSVLSSTDVLKKTETLGRFCKPILMKPRPATPEAPPTRTPQASEQQQPQGVDANASTAEGAVDGNGETPTSAEVMDIETSSTSARSPFKWFLPLNVLFFKKEFGSYV